MNQNNRLKTVWLAFLCFLVTSFFIDGASFAEDQVQPVQPTSPELFPPLIHSIQFEKKMSFCGQSIPMDNTDVVQRLEKEMLLSLWNRPQVILWLKRSGRYFSHIEKILKENNLHLDYKYVPIVESALRPHAGSRKGAVGYWQFLKSTGRRYGLKIDHEIDERRNIFKSTRAAVKYLQKLKSDFGSDFLALAAYNMGETGLKKAIKAQNSKDFFSLYLPIETQRYVFKLMVVKMIFEAPEKYGFNLEPADIYKPLVFDLANIKTDVEIPLLLIADAASTSFKAVKDLNPDLRGYFLAKGQHSVMIPKGGNRKFRKNFNAAYKKWKSEHQPRVHVVREGESLGLIAQKYNMTLTRLLKLNNFSRKKMIHPGDRLKVN